MTRQRKPEEKNRSEKTCLEGSLGCYAMMLRDSPFCSSSNPRASVALPTRSGHNSVGDGWGCHDLSCRARKGHASRGFAWQPQKALQIEVILEQFGLAPLLRISFLMCVHEQAIGCKDRKMSPCEPFAALKANLVRVHL